MCSLQLTHSFSLNSQCISGFIQLHMENFHSKTAHFTKNLINLGFGGVFLSHYGPTVMLLQLSQPTKTYVGWEYSRVFVIFVLKKKENIIHQQLNALIL